MYIILSNKKIAYDFIEYYLNNPYLSSPLFLIISNPLFKAKKKTTIDILQSLYSSLIYLLNHFDHIYYLEEVYKIYKPKIFCHKNAIEKIFNDSLNLSSLFGKALNIDLDKSIFTCIKDNDCININDVTISVLYTPGHSSCSVSYLIKSDNILFTGDTLFYRSIGRSDLYSGNSLSLSNSLKKIASLNRDYIVYPGHDRATTIGDELKNNLMFNEMIK